MVMAGRLLPFGAGMAAPAAPNTTEAGRAKNRRVQLVPQ
jgi:outer membrane protein OmpA-like peptidoglycan-associated protein